MTIQRSHTSSKLSISTAFRNWIEFYLDSTLTSVVSPTLHMKVTFVSTNNMTLPWRKSGTYGGFARHVVHVAAGRISWTNTLHNQAWDWLLQIRHSQANSLQVIVQLSSKYLPLLKSWKLLWNFNSATCNTGALVRKGRYKTAESRGACELVKVILIL